MNISNNDSTDANTADTERRGQTHVEQLGAPSAAYQAEHPWCGWRIAFAAESDADTVSAFGLTERLTKINLLLTTADGRSRPVMILDTAADMPSEGDTDLCERGIEITELDTEHYEPMTPPRRSLVRYEDIREIVIF